ncbi:hypothetical protein GGI19_000730 [Coemansia pectinata]|uniref:Uncharacterized protein n=1 Tax=Coemansia pectinata TaxID=1052879 RepID=A0A9W8GZJ4_9FUNG|nr:hypothetical protein GGI19_000730 [Coemansia pectinata]
MMRACILRRAMCKILKRATRVDPADSRVLGNSSGDIPGSTRRPSSVSGAGSRRNSTSRPATDILSHIQELKDKERHVLSRGARDLSSAPGPGGMTGPPGLPPNVVETLSRQERLAREEKLAAQYREQLKAKLRTIRDTAIDLGAQKATMAHFERQLFGSGSPKEADLLELERINGVRSLLGLPPLSQPSAASLTAGTGGVRASRPGTPIYAASSPTNIPSPYSHPQHLHRSSVGIQSKHCRTSSFGESSLARPTDRHHRHAPTPSRDIRRHQAEDDDMEQDMDLGMEDGELSEEGELAE